VNDIGEEWKYLDWKGEKMIAAFNGKRFKTRREGDTKALESGELEYLPHNKGYKCRLRPQDKSKLRRLLGSTSFTSSARLMAGASARQRLPRYTFKETAQQIEKDRAIFAKMGVDSSQLAFDGLLRAEFGHRPKPGPCDTVHDVTKKVQALISSGSLTFDAESDLASILKLDNAPWREPHHPEHLFLQYRVAGEPREHQLPRKLVDDARLYVGLKKLVPVVRLTCADLVDRLIEVPSSRFTENFFLTLPYHSAPDYVLQLLLKRTYPQIDSPLRPRIFAVLKKWAQTYPEDFGDTELFEHLLDAAKEMTSLSTKELKFHDRETIRLLKTLTTSLTRLEEDLVRDIPFVMWPQFMKLEEAAECDQHSLNLLGTLQNVKFVAVELTLLSEKRLHSLSGRDFIKKGYSETKRNQMHISEHMARWVGTVVLLQKDKEKLVKTANRWLSVAKMCYEMNNFNTLFEILVGLQQTPVARLLKHEEEYDMKTLDNLRDLTKMDGNYKAYRAALKKKKGRPCVPYFGVLLRDMLCYEEAQPKIKSKFKDGTVWVNLKKVERMGQLVSDALLFKGNRYTKKSNADILKLIEDSMRSARNENALYDMSYKIKPRGT